jgi:hypothetical protein
MLRDIVHAEDKADKKSQCFITVSNYGTLSENKLFADLITSNVALETCAEKRISEI